MALIASSQIQWLSSSIAPAGSSSAAFAPSAIETLAAACGARAQCDQKYEYLDISLSALRDDQAALLGIADLIELTSDHEDVGDAMCRYLTHAEIKSLRTEMRRDGQVIAY